MTTERSRYLAEKMGICYHEWIEEIFNGLHLGYFCKNDNCRIHTDTPFQFNPSTPDGFIKVLEWAKGQEWWGDFWYKYLLCSSRPGYLEVIDLIGPCFAEEIVNYLMERDHDHA